MQRPIKVVVLILLIALLDVLDANAPATARATSLTSFSHPSQIRVRMFRLYDPSGESTGIECQNGDTNYGCTAAPALGSYPWGSQNPVTVEIEGTAPTNRYLLDVVPRESGPDVFLPAAIQAQAIAARTYVYWHSALQAKAGIPEPLINNSTAFQVFVPYWYNVYTYIYGSPLGTQYQQVVNTALADRFYLSNHTGYWYYDPVYNEDWVWMEGDDPIFAEFFADIPLRTVTNPTFTYQVQVEDPISSHPDVVQDGHGRGMSQNGAGRWARGSSSFRCDPYPAPCPVPPSVPHFAWSVSWSERYRILTHYYTGSHVRDAGNTNAIVTPDRRFVVLSVNGGPLTGRICRNRYSRLTLRLQNTGVAAWDASAVALGYCWGSQCTLATWLPQAVAAGATYPPTGEPEWTVEIAPGSGALTLDLYSPSGWFSAQNPAWPRQMLALPVVSCRFLPNVPE